MNTTKRLTEREKDRFFEAFFREERDLDPGLAERLARKSAAAFSSVQVRPEKAKSALESLRGDAPSAGEADDASPSEAVETRDAFNPYSVGLVPTYQREGRSGLLKRLSAFADPAQLRSMAQAQNVSLDARAKAATDARQVAAAIAEAVAKRIANRRAAAG